MFFLRRWKLYTKTSSGCSYRILICYIEKNYRVKNGLSFCNPVCKWLIFLPLQAKGGPNLLKKNERKKDGQGKERFLCTPSNKPLLAFVCLNSFYHLRIVILIFRARKPYNMATANILNSTLRYFYLQPLLFSKAVAPLRGHYQIWKSLPPCSLGSIGATADTYF